MCKCVPRFRAYPQTRIKPRKNARNIGSAVVPQVPRLGVRMYDINKIENKIQVIEREAMSGREIPEDYTQPEQLLFLSLRVLHWEYRHRVITKEQAKEEKALLAREYIQAARFQVVYQEAIEARNRMGQYLTDAVKHGCPICKKIIEIFDGREKSVPSQPERETAAELPDPLAQLRGGEEGAVGEGSDAPGV